MLFRSYKPAPPLSDFIENFWLYDGYESPHFRERIFPSGTFELVFNLRDDELRIYKATQPDQCAHFSGAIVSGPYHGFFATDTEEEASVMGVHFRPGGAFPFLGILADDLADSHIDLEDIWGRQASRARERLCGETSPKAKFRLLEELLLSRLSGSFEHHPAVSLALEGLRLNNSRAIVRKLARDAGLSDRRFIDVFRFEVGLKPKLFNRVQRFQRVLHLVHRVAEPDWRELAVEHGYFDQSHLIRDFLIFSGLTPADYLHRLRDLRSKRLHPKFNHLPIAE
jgi:AraC-like DNA-binding protein